MRAETSPLLTRLLWAVLAATLLGLSGCGPETPVTPAAQAPAPASQVERGAYLARIGNCAHCHTARGGEPYAGGRAVDTPFGQVVSSNITPEPVYGLGRWTAEDFWRALHHGESKDGRLLYPAFPYTSYTHVTREDADALWAYLRTVAPSTREREEHALRWPYSTQLALWVWRTLYFQPAAATQAAQSPNTKPKDASLERGQYLVQGLGHCDECHGARNALGGFQPQGPQGNVLAGSRWYAPSLLDRSEASVADWTEADVVALLTTGVSPRGHAQGPMANVVRFGTQYLSADDALAMARYLRQLSATSSRPPAALEPSPALDALLRSGEGLYEKHCQECHGASGEGKPGVYPALAASRTVSMAQSNNLAHIVLEGGFAPSTRANPRPYGMPPFVLTLSDEEIAAVLSYIRYQWGNTAAPVGEFDITSMRR